MKSNQHDDECGFEGSSCASCLNEALAAERLNAPLLSNQDCDVINFIMNRFNDRNPSAYEAEFKADDYALLAAQFAAGEDGAIIAHFIKILIFG